MSKKPTVLMILDGYGLNDNKKANAAAIAKTPVLDRLMTEYPFVEGNASGMDCRMVRWEIRKSVIPIWELGALYTRN